MQKYTEHSSEIESLYRDNLNDIPVDTTGMWEDFETKLSPAGSKFSITKNPKTWLKISIGLNVLLGACVCYFLAKSDSFETKINPEQKITEPIVVSPSVDLPEPVPAKSNTEKTANDVLPKSGSDNGVSNTLGKDPDPIHDNETTEINVKPELSEMETKAPVSSTTSVVKNAPSDSLATDNIKEYYKGKTGTKKLFK